MEHPQEHTISHVQGETCFGESRLFLPYLGIGGVKS